MLYFLLINGFPSLPHQDRFSTSSEAPPNLKPGVFWQNRVPWQWRKSSCMREWPYCRCWGKGEITHYIERMEHLISCSLKATKTFIYKHFYNRVTLLNTEQSNVQQTSCWTGNNTVWVWYYFNLMLTSTTNISCQAVGPYLKSVHNSIHCALVVYFISQKYIFKKLYLQIYWGNKRPFKCT